jgi:peroxiredoxin
LAVGRYADEVPRLLAVVLSLGLLVGVGHAGPAPSPGPSPWLGIGLAATPRGGARITELLPDAPAELSGLKVGDVVRSLDGAAIAEPAALIAAIGKRAVGDTVLVEVERAGARQTISVALAPRPTGEELQRARIARLIDHPAPAWSLAVAAGKGPGGSDALRGKVVVVEMLATWCQPCKSTYGPLTELDAARDVVVVGISPEEPGLIAELARTQKIGFTILHDPDAGLARRLAAPGTPAYVVIDPKGIVRHLGVGAGPGLERAIAVATSLRRAPK